MEKETFNAAADITYGLYCCLSFAMGTFGNIISFLHFKSKRRDIANVIYMFITGTDIVISILVLFTGLSYLSERDPGKVFGNEYGCAVWIHTISVSVNFSVFLTVCLSVSRTLSLLYPFKQQKVRYMVIVVTGFLLATSSVEIGTSLMIDLRKKFSYYFVTCVFEMNGTDRSTITVLMVINIIIRLTPAFIVALSCVISVMELTRRNEELQQRELQQSRNRATITILLFSLLYELCNLPHALLMIIILHNWLYNDRELDSNVFQFDKKYYLNNAMYYLIPGNSAANPVLYFWRMPSLRENLMLSFGKLFRINRMPRSNRNVMNRNIVVPQQNQHIPLS